MVSIHFAHTAPANPPSAPSILTHAQIWAGLERKVRAAQDFVPPIISTTVLEEKKMDDPPVIIREVQFKEGAGPALAMINRGRVTETCLMYAPCRVEFQQVDGSQVQNIISTGVEEGELYLTYLFEWRHPEFKEVDRPAIEFMRKKYAGMAKTAVESSLVAIREMVKDGRIAV